MFILLMGVDGWHILCLLQGVFGNPRLPFEGGADPCPKSEPPIYTEGRVRWFGG